MLYSPLYVTVCEQDRKNYLMRPAYTKLPSNMDSTGLWGPINVKGRCISCYHDTFSWVRQWMEAYLSERHLCMIHVLSLLTQDGSRVPLNLQVYVGMCAFFVKFFGDWVVSIICMQVWHLKKESKRPLCISHFNMQLSVPMQLLLNYSVGTSLLLVLWSFLSGENFGFHLCTLN